MVATAKGLNIGHLKIDNKAQMKWAKLARVIVHFESPNQEDAQDGDEDGAKPRVPE